MNKELTLKEIKSLKARIYYQENRERILSKQNAYYEENKEARQAYQREYFKNNNP